jgi:hypothetical protein
MMVFVVFIIASISFIGGYLQGEKEKKAEILEKNPDYFLTKDLKIEKIWCDPN